MTWGEVDKLREELAIARETIEGLRAGGKRLLDVSDNPGMWSTSAPAGWCQELVAAREELRLAISKAEESK